MTAKSLSALLAAAEEGIKPFALLRYGIAVGYGLAFHSSFNLFDKGTPALIGPATGYLTYAGFLPGFLSKNVETNMYCASYMPKSGLESADLVATLKTFNGQVPDGLSEYEIDQRVLEKRGWQRRVGARCGILRKVGLFVGKPGKLETNVAINSVSDRQLTTVRPLIAFGVMAAPWPFVHLLAGVTVSNVGVGDPSRDVLMNSYFFAIGTSFDAIGNVFK